MHAEGPRMAETPRFSVTIPAYNAESTLAETVASVQAQSFSDFEIVICNDGSTDGTLALAESLAMSDPRIRVVSQENRGSGGAYNTAVRNARSDLIVMLSADDLLLPEHLAAFDAFIGENPDASVFTCDGYFEYDDGRREPQDLNAGWADPSSCDTARPAPGVLLRHRRRVPPRGLRHRGRLPGRPVRRGLCLLAVRPGARFPPPAARSPAVGASAQQGAEVGGRAPRTDRPMSWPSAKSWRRVCSRPSRPKWRSERSSDTTATSAYGRGSVRCSVRASRRN